MGIRGWQKPPRVFVRRESAERFHADEYTVEFENRSTTTAAQVIFVASKCDKKRSGGQGYGMGYAQFSLHRV